MNQKDGGKYLDADILQCKADILRARVSISSVKTTNHNPKEKQQVSKTHIPSGNRIQTPPTDEIHPQSTLEKEKAEIGPKSDIMTRMQTADTQNIKNENSESESMIPVRNQKEEKLLEGTGYAQSNEAKIIKQVKLMASSSKQTGGEEVPRFNLAEQIMAEQRKNSATKRKSPDKRIAAIKNQACEACSASPLEQTAGNKEKEHSSVQQEIIARIVSQDIERLSRGRGQRGQRSFDKQRL